MYEIRNDKHCQPFHRKRIVRYIKREKKKKKRLYSNYETVKIAMDRRKTKLTNVKPQRSTGTRQQLKSRDKKNKNTILKKIIKKKRNQI